MKFAEIPQRLNPLLHPPDPIVINHIISVEELRHSESKKTACYDIDVEVCSFASRVSASPLSGYYAVDDDARLSTTNFYSQLWAPFVLGRRYPQDADEQLPALHRQPAGDTVLGQQDP